MERLTWAAFVDTLMHRTRPSVVSAGAAWRALRAVARAACGPPCPAPRPGGVAAGAALGASPDPSAIGVQLLPVGARVKSSFIFPILPP